MPSYVFGRVRKSTINTPTATFWRTQDRYCASFIGDVSMATRYDTASIAKQISTKNKKYFEPYSWDYQYFILPVDFND